MSYTALTMENRQLALEGKRRCVRCKQTFPITEAHWYFDKKGRVVKAKCRRCWSLYTHERDKRTHEEKLADARRQYYARETAGMTDSELRAYDARRKRWTVNKQIRLIGEQICNLCGRRLRLDPKNFPWIKRDRCYDRRCRDCQRVINRERNLRRKSNAEWRRKTLERVRRYYSLPANRERARVNRARHRRKTLAEKMRRLWTDAS